MSDFEVRPAKPNCGGCFHWDVDVKDMKQGTCTYPLPKLVMTPRGVLAMQPMTSRTSRCHQYERRKVSGMVETVS